MAIATGQFTIIDYNDAITLTGFISSNKVKAQVWNPDNGAYNPDWTVGPYLVLTPSIFKAGSATDIIASMTSPTWKSMIGGVLSGAIITGGSYVVGATTPFSLTVNQNILTGATSAVDFIFECNYTDPTTGLLLTYKTSVSFSKNSSGGGITDAIAWAPLGNAFKNNGGGNLTAYCSLFRGALEDLTAVTYQWYIQNGGTDDVGIVGTGWNRIDAAFVTANPLLGAISGYTTNTLTFGPSAVTNVEVFKCAIRDADTTVATYQQYFCDTVTFIDMTDPLQVVITSTGGDIFKNAIGSTVLTAKVYQNGTEVDVAGSTYTYTWTIKDQAGAAASFVSSPTGATRVGKTTTILDTDITVKGTIEVNLT